MTSTSSSAVRDAIARIGAATRFERVATGALAAFVASWALVASGAFTDSNVREWQIVTMQPLADRTAIAIVANEHDRHRRLVRLTDHGLIQWSSPVPWDFECHDCLVLHDDRAFVTAARDHVAVAAYALADGARLWATKLPARADELGLKAHVAVVTSDTLYVDIHGAARELVVLDASTGRVVRRGDEPLHDVHAIGDTVFDVEDHSVNVLRRAGRQRVEAADSRGHACVLDGQLVQIQGWETPVLHALEIDERKPPQWKPRMRLSVAYLEACARYRDRFVFAERRRDATHLVIVDAGGARSHYIELPEQLGWESGSLTGELTRFAPVIVGSPSETLVMLDLETGIILWQLRLPELMSYRIERRAGSWFVVSNMGDFVVELDPSTGALRHAVQASDRRWSVAAGGTIWAYDSSWAPIDQLPLARVALGDERQHPELEDVTEALRREIKPHWHTEAAAFRRR